MTRLYVIILMIVAVLVTGCGGSAPAAPGSSEPAATVAPKSVRTKKAALKRDTRAKKAHKAKVRASKQVKVAPNKKKPAQREKSRSGSRKPSVRHSAIPKGYQLFKSPDGGYSLAYPRDWITSRNALKLNMGEVGELTGHILMPKDRKGNVLIMSVTLSERSRLTTEGCRDQVSAAVAGSDLMIIQRGKTTMSGKSAYRMRLYGRTDAGNNIEATHVVWVSDSRAFLIQYATAPGEHQPLLPKFNQMLRTFREL